MMAEPVLRWGRVMTCSDPFDTHGRSCHARAMGFPARPGSGWLPLAYLRPSPQGGQ